MEGFLKNDWLHTKDFYCRESTKRTSERGYSSLQANGSFQLPVCVRLCRCNSSLRVKRLPQYIQPHTKGRSPVCHRRWARKWDVFPYTFPQPGMWQICCFFLPGSPELLQKSSMQKVRTEQRTALLTDPLGWPSLEKAFRRQLWLDYSEISCFCLPGESNHSQSDYDKVL